MNEEQKYIDFEASNVCQSHIYVSGFRLGVLEPEFSKRCQGWYPLRAGAGLVRLERNGL